MDNLNIDINSPKRIWGTIINAGGGLIFSKPRLFIRNDCYGFTPLWWTKCKNWSVQKIGYDSEKCGYVTFTSIDKKDVENFILGAKAICNYINYWSNFKKNG
jgi:hypothetical protein